MVLISIKYWQAFHQEMFENLQYHSKLTIESPICLVHYTASQARKGLAIPRLVFILTERVHTFEAFFCVWYPGREICKLVEYQSLAQLVQWTPY